MTLNQLKRNQSAEILSIGGEGSLRQHFLDMGLIPGKIIQYIKSAPMGDPIEFRIWGYELTLRKKDAEKIDIRPMEKAELSESERSNPAVTPHPGLGEMNREHVRQKSKPLDENVMLTFGLAGNQNSGKTTLFNQLTGSNQRVGNFPGVTMDRKSGQIRRLKNTLVTDLPGIYSMSPYSNEEIISRDFFLKDKPKGIINIVDATNIERNLYLTMQLIELDIPMVLALNMMDEVRENGGTIRINDLESELGIPVIPISASKNEGIDELIEHAVHVAKYCERPKRTDFCLPSGRDKGAVHRCLHSIMHLIEDHAKKYDIPVRFAAGKLLEGDRLMLERLCLDGNEKELLEHVILQMEKESGMDRSAALANMRFTFIEKVCRDAVIRTKESKEFIRSQKIDRILTGKYTGIPSFVAIMALIFWLTFGVLGKWLSDFMELIIAWFTGICDSALTAAGVNPVIHSLIIDGAFAGVGAVLGFLPLIVLLFFFLSFLEDSGYMARVAFVMDKLLRKLGLSGRSFVPMIIGFGCSVPAIMATRTLPSERDRKMTIMLAPFMSCSAKLPIYGMITMVFFPKYSALVITSMYFIGIAIAVIYALILDRTKFRGVPVPFVMELPNYRFPSLKSMAKLIWYKAKDFMTRAFTIIFVGTMVIWFLRNFDSAFNVVSDSKDSLLAALGGFISPIFVPLGFADFRISTALIAGFTAKEAVVSSMTVLFGNSPSMLHTVFSPLTAFVFLIFTLLYTPCIAAISAVKRELGWKWAAVLCLLQCLIAWIAAFAVHMAGTIILRI